jgi:hypothetical protein
VDILSLGGSGAEDPGDPRFFIRYIYFFNRIGVSVYVHRFVGEKGMDNPPGIQVFFVR